MTAFVSSFSTPDLDIRHVYAADGGILTDLQQVDCTYTHREAKKQKQRVFVL